MTTEEYELIDKMVRTVEWIQPDTNLYDGDRLAFRHEGILVRGLVELHPRKIKITVELPKAGATGTDMLDSNMPVIFTEHPYEKSPASHVGKERAKRLLISLFYLFESNTS